jgi:hypothetical protein
MYIARNSQYTKRDKEYKERELTHSSPSGRF